MSTTSTSSGRTVIQRRIAFGLLGALAIAMPATFMNGGSAFASPSATESPSPVASSPQTPAVDPAATSVCLEAGTLSLRGYPQRAIAIIDKFNASQPTGSALSCLQERDEAVRRTVAAENWALLPDEPQAVLIPVPAPSVSLFVNCQSPQGMSALLT